MSAIALVGAAAPTRRVGALMLGVVLAGVVVGGVAALDPVAAVGLVLVLAFVAVTFKNPTLGLVLFTAMIFFEYVFFQFGATLLVKAAGGVLAAAWAVHVVSRRGQVPLLVRDRPVVAGALAALVLWALASSLWADDGAVASSAALRMSQGVLLVFIAYTLLRELRHFRWLLSAYVIGALCSAAFALVSGGSGERLGGGDAGNANDLAAFFIPAVIICAFMLFAEPRILMRLALSGAGLVLLLALLMTGSRGGLLGLLVALAAALIVAGKGRGKVVAAAFVILASVMVYYTTAASPQQVERLMSVRDDGGTGRSDLWSVAIQTARDRPLTGVGAGNFRVVEPRYAATEISIERVDLVLDRTKVVHNTYLGVLSELGAIGLSAFVFILLAAVLSTVQALGRLRREPWPLQVPVRGFLVAMLGILAAFTFITSEYEKQLWLLVGVAIALPAMARRHGRGEPAGDRFDTPAVNVEDVATPPLYDQRVEQVGEDPGGTLGGDDGSIVPAARRLARREAALAERERAVERREQALRAGPPDGRHGTREAAPQAAETHHARVVELEARVAELEEALAQACARLAKPEGDTSLLAAGRSEEPRGEGGIPQARPAPGGSP